MPSQQMTASVMTAYGDPEVIHQQQVAVPTPGPADVLIRVAATSFNPLDAAIRSGRAQALVPVQFPYTFGLDVAGVITATGNGVTGLTIGQRVIAFQDRERGGAAADYVACRAALVVPAPTTIPLAAAAALPLTGLTAWQALFEHGQLQAGQRVLVTAASGGVGSLAVQLAKWKGAYVIGTSSVAHTDSLRQLGIDEVIDYQSQRLEEVVTEPVDLILNTAPLDSAAVNGLLKLLKAGGVLVSTALPADPAEAERLGVRAIRMGVQSKADQLTELVQLVDTGRVRPLIQEQLPISALADMHRRAGQTHGKVVLVVDEQLR